MCGLAFGTPEQVINIFKKQSFRGLDSVGIISNQRALQPHLFGPEGTTGQLTEAKYVEMLTEHFQEFGLTENILMHHRKGSVGTGGLGNAHPYWGRRFLLMQNGTAKDMRVWGDIELIDKDKSDTYCLLQYLENHCKTLKEVADKLTIAHWNIGTIFLVDSKNHILFFSDKLRESYITFEDNKVKEISSKNPNAPNVEYYNKGYMIFDFEGNIQYKQLEGELNEIKPARAPAIHYYPDNNYYSVHQAKREKIYNDIDAIYLALVESGGFMHKRIYKHFIKAYDEYIEKVSGCKTYQYLARKEFDGKFIVDREYQARLWQKKYPTMLSFFNEYGIEPDDGNMAMMNVYGGPDAFRKKANEIIAELRKGRIVDPLLFLDSLDNKAENEAIIVEEKKQDAEVKLLDTASPTLPTQQLTVDDFPTNDKPPHKYIVFTTGDTILFEDGDRAEAIDDQRVIFNDKSFTVYYDVTTKRKFIQMKIDGLSWILGSERKTTEYKRKYICLSTNQGT